MAAGNMVYIGDYDLLFYIPIPRELKASILANHRRRQARQIERSKYVSDAHELYFITMTILSNPINLDLSLTPLIVFLIPLNFSRYHRNNIPNSFLLRFQSQTKSHSQVVPSLFPLTIRVTIYFLTEIPIPMVSS